MTADKAIIKDVKISEKFIEPIEEYPGQIADRKTEDDYTTENLMDVSIVTSKCTSTLLSLDP
jgi:hypothetical protein